MSEYQNPYVNEVRRISDVLEIEQLAAKVLRVPEGHRIGSRRREDNRPDGTRWIVFDVFSTSDDSSSPSPNQILDRRCVSVPQHITRRAGHEYDVGWTQALAKMKGLLLGEIAAKEGKKP